MRQYKTAKRLYTVYRCFTTGLFATIVLSDIPSLRYALALILVVAGWQLFTLCQRISATAAIQELERKSRCYRYRTLLNRGAVLAVRDRSEVHE